MNVRKTMMETAGLHPPMEWGLAIVSILLIDIVLAGDNAVVIALAIGGIFLAQLCRHGMHKRPIGRNY